ncbi:MAG: phosphatase PAP2 family protein [Bacteroidales bacterium]|nr:phosphatase PAP2 family protein [Bacteroidales bacterium]
MKKLFLVAGFSIVFTGACGQADSVQSSKVYCLNYKYEIPLTIGQYALDFYLLSLLTNKPALNTQQINSLNKTNIWTFDRRAVNQSYNEASRNKALTASDWGMNIMAALPALLLLDKKIQKDWYDVLFLYVETQAVNLLFTYSGPLLTTRKRPIVYMPAAPMDEKLKSGTTNSFFSGHTSTTAAASFFIAKVISDYHPELGAKKWLLFAAALIPPTFVGYQRYRGFKHFPTDIAAGTAIGATIGILTPHLHKKRSMYNLSVVPITGQYNGLVVNINF